MEARGVDDDDLRFLVSDYATDDVTGGLRLRRGNGDLGTNQGVGESRLAGIWAPDEADEPGVESGSGRFSYPGGHIVNVGNILVIAIHEIGQRRHLVVTHRHTPDRGFLRGPALPGRCPPGDGDRSPSRR